MPEPMWHMDDFASVSTCDLFSEDRWGIKVEWEILLEQAKKIDSIVLLIDKYDYPSRLFLSYLDILDANLHIYSDLFYYLIGEHMGTSPNRHDFFQKGQAGCIYQRLFFWNLDYIDEMAQIRETLVQAQTHFIECLKQNKLKDICSQVAKKWNMGFYLNNNANKLGIIWFKDRAYDYAIEAYREEVSPGSLVKQIVDMLNILSNAIHFFCLSSELPKNCFPGLLEKFRNSEQGQNLIKAWLYDLDGPRDRLIANMEKTQELTPWVHRYLHIRKDGEVIEQLFYDEMTGFMLDEKEYYNTCNWISILKIATLLQEYDERNSGTKDDERSVTKTHKKTKCIKQFREFVKDAGRTEEIIGKLHRLIGNKTNTDALKIIAEAMWIDLIDKPTAPSIRNEFHTITCTGTIFSRCLNDPRPTVPKELDKIKKKFENA